MLTTYDQLKSWANFQGNDGRKAEAERCIAAASAWICSRSARVLEKAAQTTIFDGGGAHGSIGDVLQLPWGHRPVVHPANFSVSEDGVALTTATGYSTTADVVVVGANKDQPCRLVRRGRSWSPGLQNITATYDAGFEANAIPATVIQLANEIALLFFNSPSWIGIAQKQGEKGSVVFDKEITEMSRLTLHDLGVEG